MERRVDPQTQPWQGASPDHGCQTWRGAEEQIRHYSWLAVGAALQFTKGLIQGSKIRLKRLCLSLVGYQPLTV